MNNHYANLKQHYQFDDKDAQILFEMRDKMQLLNEKFIDEFYDYIWNFGSTAKFLKNREIIANHRKKIQEWFMNLFSGKYDMVYIARV